MGLCWGSLHGSLPLRVLEPLRVEISMAGVSETQTPVPPCSSQLELVLPQTVVTNKSVAGELGAALHPTSSKSSSLATLRQT